MKFSISTFGMSCLMLSACATHDNFHTPKSLPNNWQNQPTYQVPPRQVQDQLPVTQSNNAKVTSLWSISPKSLFGDRRASQAGDIITVVVEINDEAEMINSTSQSRITDQNFSVGALFGLPEVLSRSLPDGASLAPAVDITRGSNVNGDGNIRREESLTLRLAARVVDVMPNGYLSLSGKQEIMVNNEVRYLQVTGLIRTQDISRLNTITYDKIAEARIFYGGQGQVTDAVKSRIGNKLLTKVLPF